MFLLIRNFKTSVFNVTRITDEQHAADLLDISGADGGDYAAHTVSSAEELGEFGLSFEESETLYEQGSGKKAPSWDTKAAGAKAAFIYLDSVAVSADDFVLPGKKSKAKKAPATGPRKSKGINVEPKSKAVPVRQGTKQHILLAALDDGATLADLQKALPTWSSATIKSALYHDVNNLKGYGISTQLIDGEPLYTLVMPKGVEAILVTPTKEK